MSKSKLSPVSWIELVKRLRKLGFDGPYQGGKHPYMIKNNLVLTIPNPHRKKISVDLLSRILKHAGITRAEWLKETEK
ncbi:type II toxin-antitoxin system HicA family toxin [ANME-1 cluster archaeon GoMg4]|nr:type II toxin-antitoxin system HicA family toxin [ANME-1 cluster archaeon GoMg4]